MKRICLFSEYRISSHVWNRESTPANWTVVDSLSLRLCCSFRRYFRSMHRRHSQGSRTCRLTDMATWTSPILCNEVSLCANRTFTLTVIFILQDTNSYSIRILPILWFYLIRIICVYFKHACQANP